MLDKRKSKWAAGALAATMIYSGIGWSATTAFAASPFSDVTAGHWAEKHISKLALQGILKGGTGTEAGKFNPNKNVSREEAVLIALRFMGIEDQVKSDEVLVFPSELTIGNYYKPYIKLALQKKILMIDEETELAKKEKGKDWGKSPATREWITRLLVRAIGKDAEAKLAASQATSFNDDTSIDAKLKGYVNVGIASGIITGVTVTNGAGASVTKFDPVAPVTRATASTLFSRAESKISVAYSGQVTGVLLAMDANKLTLLHQDGVVKDYTISTSTSVYRFDSEKASSLADLKLYGEVSLISEAGGSIGYVEQTSDTAKVKTYEGTLTRVSTSLNRLTLLVGEDSVYYYYDPLHLPSVKDANGQTLTLDNLPVNATVKLLVDAVRTDGKILSITVNQSVVNKTGTGTVAAWSAATRSLQVKATATSLPENFPVSANATIKKNGINVAPEDMKLGDTITYEVKSGSVTSIVITKSEQPTISGILNAINKTDKTIQYTVNGELSAKFMADNVIVKIEGYADATLDDVYKGDPISLTFNDSGKVSVISVTGNVVSNLTGATISSYVSDAKTLIVFDSAGKKYNLDVNASTRFDLNGTKLTLETATPLISSKGKKVNIGISGTNVIYVSIIAKYSGTVTENNTSARTLKLSLDGSGSITLPYVSPIVEIYGSTAKSYADVRVGDQVTVLLNGSQDQASSILVQKTAQFDFISSDTTNNKLRTKRADGVVEEWTLGSNIVLQDESGAATTLGALNNAGLLNITFQGNTPIKIKTVSVSYGRVSSVNTAGASVDLVLPNGSTVTKTVGSTPLILKNNVVQSSLSTVSPDDRVEIRKDENDRVVIEVVPLLRKLYWYYEADSRTLNVKKETLADTNFSFTLHSQVYIHQGTTTLSLTDLRNDDAISLYVLRGKVFEIAK
ncbi:S-layer homology domain-containing protein [Cohnella endophytica]|uniref:S-layer homology domain-containing protein n=1 Tax=Cohnella endophytica TaxID=2419778 RepID=A0A494Y2M3_9BACL|nr:S-layer homology domain-containing protein [Cohnella endophytica]RKP56996.1 S-layer homology domain-containing protein [Cohnella endophytica]